ncbi:MAG: sulfatase-like hydrolase/transferase [Thermoanaerobaculia bacterium]|jgi:arylsulfatase A-like enzyme/Flp pilus assembly protein TadD
MTRKNHQPSGPEAETKRLRSKAVAGIIALVVVAAVVAIFLSMRSERRRQERPNQDAKLLSSVAPTELNVILITVDTLRADRLGAYGSQRVATPHMDKLAAEGILFSNAASTVPFTLPAHSSIMTGTYPPFHGVRENVGYVLGSSLPTLAEKMAASGRSTAAFVSAFVLDSRWGIGRGFDTYFDEFDLKESESANLGSVQRDGTDTIAAAVRWLDTDPERPLFLWLHLYDPHDPYEPIEPYRSQYPDRPYEGEVAYTDFLIGEFRSALAERNLLDTSLLILTGDHGEGLGQHREGFHGFFVYDSTVHVPLIVRLPDSAMAGRTVDQPVSHVDLLPTILEAAGQSIPARVQGRSLAPLIVGSDQKDEPDRAVYSESMYPLLHYGWAPLRSLRKGQYKFIDSPQPELYDLMADPLEQNNILLDERRTSRELKDQLDLMVEQLKSDEPATAEPADLDEETLLQLRALGYVAGSGGIDVDEENAWDRTDPKDRIGLHQLVMAAQSDFAKDDLQQASQKLEEVLATDPSVVDAHQMLGSIAIKEERYEEAVGHFKGALVARDDHITSIRGLAHAYRMLGREEEALLGFQQLLSLEPGDTMATLGTAEILVDLDRRADAIEILQETTGRPEPAPVLLNQLGELLTLEGRKTEAIAAFDGAIALKPDLMRAKFNLAVLLEEQGESERAVTHYEEVIDQAPDHFQAQFNLGRLYGAMGDSARQQEMWEAAIASNPDFARGYFFLAKLLMDQGGDLARAEELTRQGLETDPEHRAGPLGYFLLADILNRTGRPREANQALIEGQRIQSEG